jgi:hypothetical protein
MSDENDKPLEGADPETAPDTADVADTSPETADVPETSGDTPAPADVPETSPEEAPVAPAPGAPADVPEDPPVDKARAARKPRTDAQKAKRKADDARRKAAIKEAQATIPEPSKEALEDDKRKADLHEELHAVQADIDEAEAVILAAKERCKEILNQLYPTFGASDRHVDAVRGYIASEKKSRANRAMQPARLKAMLEAAGKAPIDAAFSAQRARGMKRPTRAPAAAAAGEGDAGKTAGAE